MKNLYGPVPSAGREEFLSACMLSMWISIFVLVILCWVRMWSRFLNRKHRPALSALFEFEGPLPCGIVPPLEGYWFLIAMDHAHVIVLSLRLLSIPVCNRFWVASLFSWEICSWVRDSSAFFECWLFWLLLWEVLFVVFIWYVLFYWGKLLVCCVLWTPMNVLSVMLLWFCELFGGVL